MRELIKIFGFKIQFLHLEQLTAIRYNINGINWSATSKVFFLEVEIYLQIPYLPAKR